MIDDISPELKDAYFRSLLGSHEGRIVLAHIHGFIRGMEVADSNSAVQKVTLTEFYEGILKNCGVTDDGMLAALAVVASQNQITEPEEETDLHGD